MKRTRTVLLSMALLLAPSVALADVRARDAAPELEGATDLGSRAFSLASLRGSWVVLTFGASWCKPCKKELAAWDRLAGGWKGRATFVAVNLDNERSTGAKFIEGLRLKHLRPVFAPQSSTPVADRYAPPTMPSTYVIDPKGVVRAVHPGYVAGDEAKLDRLLTSLIAADR